MFTQENDKYSTWRIAGVLVVFLSLGPVSAYAADPTPDILAGPAPGPCAEQAAGADYVSGVDAAGNPIMPAEGPGTTQAMGDGRVLVTVPQAHGRDVSVPVDLAELSPPACKPATPPAHR
ncbi:MAG TPA: hypothetical protein VHZ78_03150 [Rhizomicrobium sp.]|jgi:hypothetical protein|nr:hypothetical protein [Rhizomicrobium sp.]